MKKIVEVSQAARLLVNELVADVNAGVADLMDVERRIVEFTNAVGGLVTQEVIESVSEPVVHNEFVVNGAVARYKDKDRMRLRTRFGSIVTRSRRRYHLEGRSGGYYPLDERLGLDHCSGYTPLMTYLISMSGACGAYTPAARQLTAVLGFKVSSTAVQNNTERVGATLPDEPVKIISDEQQNTGCELLVAEVDGTTSPQIHEEEGVSGRESLSQPTEYRECNLVVFEKWRDGESFDRWTGGRYGPRSEFERYVHQAGLRYGQLQARQVVFIADGAKHNWDLQLNNFPDAVAILDVYHALEHLAAFCNLHPKAASAKEYYRRLETLMLEGDTLQLLHEMKSLRTNLTDPDKGQKHINYFLNNRERMAYDQYRERGYPIGSGLVEGRCKLVVGTRFKGNGMRWKKRDNAAVLNTRLHFLNGTLEAHFSASTRRRAA